MYDGTKQEVQVLDIKCRGCTRECLNKQLWWLRRFLSLRRTIIAHPRIVVGETPTKLSRRVPFRPAWPRKAGLTQSSVLDENSRFYARVYGDSTGIEPQGGKILTNGSEAVLHKYLHK